MNSRWHFDCVLALAAAVACPNSLLAKQEPDPAIERDTDRETIHDKIVHDFIQFDIGQIRDPVAMEQIKARFARLKGDDAVPALVRGLNASAQMRASCPITALSTKLRGVVNASRNPEVGTYVLQHLNRDDAGPYTHYINSVFDTAENQVVRTMRNGLAQRRLRQQSAEGQQRLAHTPGMKLNEVTTGRSNAADRAGDRTNGPPSRLPHRATTDSSDSQESAVDWSKLSMEELAAQLKDRAGQLRAITELSRRAIGGEDRKVLELSPEIIQCLADSDEVVREWSARLLGVIRCQAATDSLIEAVDDPHPRVRSAAATSLTRITRQLFGPSDDATPAERKIAQRRWREWWSRQPKRSEKRTTASSADPDPLAGR